MGTVVPTRMGTENLDTLAYGEYLASAHWSQLKDAVRRRSGGFCERCRVNRGAMVHHLAYPQSRYATTPEHLCHVCTLCHRVLHGKDPGSSEDPLLEPASLRAVPPSVPEPHPAPHLEALRDSFAAALADQAGTVLDRAGVSATAASRLGVGYAPASTWPGAPAPAGRLVFPQCDRSGRLVALAGLAIDSRGTTGHLDIVGRGTGYFGAPALHGGATVALCAHPLDAVLLEQAGATSAAVFDLRWWRPAWAVSLAAAVLVADLHAPGNGLWERCGRQLTRYRVRVADLPGLGRRHLVSLRPEERSAWISAIVAAVGPATASRAVGGPPPSGSTRCRLR